MLDLIPTECWQYSSRDLIGGLFTALFPRPSRPCIDIPGLGPSFPVRSARTAIMAALKAIALRPGAPVGVPLYCCPVVFDAIQSAGCRPRFIDVDPETFCLSVSDLAAKSSEVDAVVAVHMFGNPCDMPGLREAAPGKPFIEDCAQALGSQLNGCPAGSFGEVSVFSFRSGKYLSVGEGGAIYCGKAGLEAQLSEIISALPVPSRMNECVHVLSTYLKSSLRTMPLWGLIGSRLWEAYTEKAGHGFHPPLMPGRIYETDLDMAIRRLPRLMLWIEKQRENASYYSRNLSVDAGMLCEETPGAFFNHLQYPLRVPTPGQCDRLAAWLRTSQISTSRPYKDIAAIAAASYGYTGDCPQAERIARTVLVLPCHHALRAADIERIVISVNRGWAEIGGGRRSVAVLPDRDATSPDGQATERTA